MNGQRRDKGRKRISSETLDAFIEKARSGVPVNDICQDKAMPCLTTWYRYVNTDPLLASRWAEALQQGKAAKRNTGA
jgi:oligoribonuclease (3'-5' exoribonuclease)